MPPTGMVLDISITVIFICGISFLQDWGKLSRNMDVET